MSCLIPTYFNSLRATYHSICRFDANSYSGGILKPTIAFSREVEHQMEHWNHSLCCTTLAIALQPWPSFLKRKIILLLSGSSKNILFCDQKKKFFSILSLSGGELSTDLVEKHKKLSDKLLLMVANSNGTMKLILEETILISSIKYSPPPLATFRWIFMLTLKFHQITNLNLLQ